MSGAEIREARESAGLTQVQLAKMLEVEQPTIARWENDIDLNLRNYKAAMAVLAEGNGKVPARSSKRAKRVS